MFARRRFFRPRLEGLESRELLAFNLSISAAATTGVTTTSVAGTTTFEASASGANLSLDAIDAALKSGNNVLITGGANGSEAGTISTSGVSSRTFDNAAGTSLKFQSGTEFSSQLGNINLTGLQLAANGSIIIDAKN